MKHVFISYVREDHEVVDRLCRELRSRDVEVWLDREEILPGQRWRDAIRGAIRDGAFFIACFSKHYTSRSRTYFNEELTIAIEEIRQRATSITWFIPVRLSQCQVPERSLGAGENLLDLQWVDLFSDWQREIKKILRTMNISPLSELEKYISELTEGLVLDQWQLLSIEPGILQTNTYYALKNLITQKSIEYGYVKRGIQLVWGQESFQHIIAFEMPDAPEGCNLRFGDKIAIYMKDRGYIITKSRGYGINLTWSKTPAYQWIIGRMEKNPWRQPGKVAYAYQSVIGRMEKGNRVLSAGDKFSLINTAHSEELVHFPRSNGVSLRWRTDCHNSWGFEAHDWKKGKAFASNQDTLICRKP